MLRCEIEVVAMYTERSCEMVQQVLLQWMPVSKFDNDDNSTVIWPPLLVALNALADDACLRFTSF